MPAEATGIIDVVQELGTSASALIFFAWLIIFILKQHDKEKQQLRVRSHTGRRRCSRRLGATSTHRHCHGTC